MLSRILRMGTQSRVSSGQARRCFAEGPRLSGPEGAGSSAKQDSLFAQTIPRVLGGGIIAVLGLMGGGMLSSAAEKEAERKTQERLVKINNETTRWKQIDETMTALMGAEKLRQSQEIERERQERARENESISIKERLLSDIKEAEKNRVLQETERDRQEKLREDKDAANTAHMKQFADRINEQEKERERQERTREDQELVRQKLQDASSAHWAAQINDAEKMRREQEIERERQEHEREERQKLSNTDRETYKAFISATKDEMLKLTTKVTMKELDRSTAEKSRRLEEERRAMAENLRQNREYQHTQDNTAEQIRWMKNQLARVDCTKADPPNLT